MAGVLCDYLRYQSDDSQPVVRLVSPSDLKQRFREAGVQLELQQDQQPTSAEALLTAISTALKFSVRTGHPRFLNQLYARADPVSMAADWLTSAAHTNVHTYEVAPVFTAVELEMLSKLARCIGGAYAEDHDGLFVPGGSISNIYGRQPAASQCCSLPQPKCKTFYQVADPVMQACTLQGTRQTQTTR